MRNSTITAQSKEQACQERAWIMVESHTNISEAMSHCQAAGFDQLALCAIHLTYAQGERTRQFKRPQASWAERGTLLLVEHLRPLVRKTDRVFVYRQSIYFMLLACDLQGVEIVEDRLWEALIARMHNPGAQEYLAPRSVVSGIGAFPVPHADMTEVLQATNILSRHFGEELQTGAHSALVVEKSAPTQLWRTSLTPQMLDQDPSSTDLLAREPTTEKTLAWQNTLDLPLRARSMGVPYLSPLPSKLPTKVQQAVDAHLAQELRCCPVGLSRDTLTVAMLDPQDTVVLERLHQETGLHIFPVLTHPEALEDGLKQLV